jgi:hypothetical protein
LKGSDVEQAVLGAADIVAAHTAREKEVRVSL